MFTRPYYNSLTEEQTDLLNAWCSRLKELDLKKEHHKGGLRLCFLSSTSHRVGESFDGHQFYLDSVKGREVLPELVGPLFWRRWWSCFPRQLLNGETDKWDLLFNSTGIIGHQHSVPHSITCTPEKRLQSYYSCEYAEQQEAKFKHSYASIDLFEHVEQYRTLRSSSREILRRCCVLAGDDDVLKSSYASERQRIEDQWKGIILDVDHIKVAKHHKNYENLQDLKGMAMALCMLDIGEENMRWMNECYKLLFVHGLETDLPTVPSDEECDDEC